MTNRITTLILVLMIDSCTMDIRKMSLEYYCQGAVDNVLEAFTEAYYRMPSSLEEVRDFCSDFRAAYSSEGTMIGMFENWMDGLSPEEYFSKKYVMMESYQDSCFIYDRKHKIGCCLYGSPCFWVNRDYRKARSYCPSFFDESGKYLFCDLGGELQSSINDLVLEYDHAIMHIENPDSVPEPFHSYFSCSEVSDTVAYQVVLRYSGSELEPLCEVHPTVRVLKYSRTEKEYSDIDGSLDLMILCADFHSALKRCLDDFVSRHQEVRTIIFRTVYVF